MLSTVSNAKRKNNWMIIMKKIKNVRFVTEYIKKLNIENISMKSTEMNQMVLITEF